jgi:hypothetical protein
MRRSIRFALVAAAAIGVVGLVAASSAQADPAGCQTAIAKQFFRLKRVSLRAHIKCLRLENLLRLPGPCPDAEAQLKIQTIAAKVSDALQSQCEASDLAALGYSNCAFEAASAGVEGTCAALPVTTTAELAACLECWKSANLTELMGILFASHALEVCGGSVGTSSPACSEMECTGSPFPDQRDLGNTSENDCQTGIAKAGFKYVVKREKILEKCALAGGTRASCLASLDVQADLATAEQKKDVLITRKCGNRDPAPSPPLCCRTGQGNECTVAADRTDCVDNLGGTVQEDKTCDLGSCAPVGGGGKKITWWSACPETCDPLATLQDLIDCVDGSADEMIDRLMCYQFRGNGGADWPCPVGSASGAFID